MCLSARVPNRMSFDQEPATPPSTKTFDRPDGLDERDTVTRLRFDDESDSVVPAYGPSVEEGAVSVVVVVEGSGTIVVVVVGATIVVVGAAVVVVDGAVVVVDVVVGGKVVGGIGEVVVVVGWVVGAEGGLVDGGWGG